MTKHTTVHLKDNIDRLCVSRKERGWSLASSVDCVETTIKWFEECTKNILTDQRIIDYIGLEQQYQLKKTFMKTTIKKSKKKKKNGDNYKGASNDKRRKFHEMNWI